MRINQSIIDTFFDKFILQGFSLFFKLFPPTPRLRSYSPKEREVSMSITIAGILEALGIEITRAIPCMASEDDPSSLCVQIYKANDGELLAIDIVEKLILDQKAPSDFQLILRNGQSLILSFSENDGKQRIHGIRKNKDDSRDGVVVTFTTIPSQLPRTQPETDS